MTFKKEISVDSIVAILSVVGAAMVVYARLCVVESKFDNTHVEVTDCKNKIEKIETTIIEHDKTLVELKTLVKTQHRSGSPRTEDSN